MSKYFPVSHPSDIDSSANFLNVAVEKALVKLIQAASALTSSLGLSLYKSNVSNLKVTPVN
jgi:hypothetical protein